MSSDGSVSPSEMDGRFKTPMPELYDHRPRVYATPQQIALPRLEVQQPTPKGSIQDPLDFVQTDQALPRQGTLKEASPTTMARDFEQAVESDQSDNEFDNPPGNGRRSSVKARRMTNRIGRGREQARHDKSRDSSSSRSTSPANSVEAFAEPRRRQRANTVDSRRSSIIEQLQRANAAYSQTSHSRRPTVSNVSVPGAFVRGNAADIEDKVSFLDDEEPGKTYKIDFEELEEFVALYAQGKISDEYPRSQAADSAVGDAKKVFGDCRRKADHHNLPNAILNGDNFFEKPVAESSTAESSSDEKYPTKHYPSDGVERFTFFSSEIQNGINATKLGDFVADGTTFRDLFDIDGTWWLDVLNPTRAELEVLAKAFKIHRLTKEDIQTQESREKVELFSQYYFVCFRSFNMDKHSEDFLDSIHVYIVVTADGVLSFSFDKTPHARNVRKRILKRGDFSSLGPDYICYAMIDDIVDCFAPIIHEAETESENIEDLVFTAREDDFIALLRQIGNCRKRVLNMMRLLGGKADVIKGFAKRCNEQYEIAPRGDIGLYLGDIQDHVVTMMSNLGHVEKMLSRSHANYLAQLNVENILKDYNTNKALAKITVVATILVPLNLITGLFGMNVPVPGRETEGLQWFFGILGVIAALVVVCLCTARKFKML